MSHSHSLQSDNKILVESERLYFRNLLPSDAQSMFELDSNMLVHQYLDMSAVVHNVEESHKIIENIRHQYETNHTGNFSLLISNNP